MAHTKTLPSHITALAKEIHFIATEVIQHNNHAAVIKGTMPPYNFPLILKVAGGLESDFLRLSNHIGWTKSLQEAVPTDAPFLIAPILRDGVTAESWRWFVSPFIEGAAFAKLTSDGMTQVNVQQPATLLPSIVSLLTFIEKVPAKSALGVDARLGRITLKNRYELLENAISWARNDTPHLADLLHIIKANSNYLQTQNAHGDFTELNLIVNEAGQSVLIDAEISSAYHYKYYDAVEFYNRLFTRADEPELATSFLQEYIKTVPKSIRQKFLSNFLCLSALRCLGNTIEIASLPESTGKQKRLQLNDTYAVSIATCSIILQ